jgi:hypothetical protein
VAPALGAQLRAFRVGRLEEARCALVAPSSLHIGLAIAKSRFLIAELLVDTAGRAVALLTLGVVVVTTGTARASSAAVIFFARACPSGDIAHGVDGSSTSFIAFAILTADDCVKSKRSSLAPVAILSGDTRRAAASASHGITVGTVARFAVGESPIADSTSGAGASDNIGLAGALAAIGVACSTGAALEVAGAGHGSIVERGGEGECGFPAIAILAGVNDEVVLAALREETAGEANRLGLK